MCRLPGNGFLTPDAAVEEPQEPAPEAQEDPVADAAWAEAAAAVRDTAQPEAAPADEPVPRKRKVPAKKAKPKRRTLPKSPFLSPPAILGLSLLLAALPVACLARNTIVGLVPHTASVFSAIGLPVNRRGLEIRDVVAFQNPAGEDRPAELVIEGDLVGVGRAGVPVPPPADRDQRRGRQAAQVVSRPAPPGDPRHGGIRAVPGEAHRSAGLKAVGRAALRGRDDAGAQGGALNRDTRFRRRAARRRGARYRCWRTPRQGPHRPGSAAMSSNTLVLIACLAVAVVLFLGLATHDARRQRERVPAADAPARAAAVHRHRLHHGRGVVAFGLNRV